jgi:TolA-binding protein
MRLVLLSLSLPFTLGLAGCLKTRNDVREVEQKQVIQQEVTKLQRTNADVSTRFADTEEDLRNLRGRLEVLEHKNGQGAQESENMKKYVSDQSAENGKKILLLQEGLGAMEKNLNQMNAELAALKADRAAADAQALAAKAKSVADSKKSAYDLGQEFFDDKEWKKAILNFQKYRDENPKGKNFAEATYKMGVCFQELGMKDEARTFYDELVGKFPNSSEAKKAKSRIKSLKKS